MLHDYIHLQYHQMREKDLFKEALEARRTNNLLKANRERRRRNRKILVSGFVQAIREAQRAARDARRSAWTESMTSVRNHQSEPPVLLGT